jgi:hypothetical protein
MRCTHGRLFDDCSWDLAGGTVVLLACDTYAILVEGCMRGSFIYLLTTSGHFTAKLLVGASSPRAQHNTKSPILLEMHCSLPAVQQQRDRKIHLQILIEG